MSIIYKLALVPIRFTSIGLSRRSVLVIMKIKVTIKNRIFFGEDIVVIKQNRLRVALGHFIVLATNKTEALQGGVLVHS